MDFLGSDSEESVDSSDSDYTDPSAISDSSDDAPDDDILSSIRPPPLPPASVDSDDFFAACFVSHILPHFFFQHVISAIYK